MGGCVFMILVCAFRGKVSVELAQTSSPRSEATPEGPVHCCSAGFACPRSEATPEGSGPLLQCRLCLPEERSDPRRAGHCCSAGFACPRSEATPLKGVSTVMVQALPTQGAKRPLKGVASVMVQALHVRSG